MTKNVRRSLQLAVTILLIAAIFGLSGCIVNVIQPNAVSGGQAFSVEIGIDPEITGTYRLYLGMQLPSGWEVVNNPTYIAGGNGSFTYDPSAVSSLNSDVSTKPNTFWWGGAGPPTSVTGGNLVSVTVTLRPSLAATGVYTINYIDGVYASTLSWREPSYPAPITVTASSGYHVFLPVTLKNSCSPLIKYNEFIRYNLDIINAPEAWACDGGQGIVVAVVDTGVDLDHPDLQTNLAAGKSFISGASTPNDDVGHGSHVAGIIAGVPNNGGIVGVAPAAKIMPVKVCNTTGCPIDAIANGIIWATDHGAKVINLSLGGGDSPTVANAVNYAYTRGALLIASAGNCGAPDFDPKKCNYQDQPSYPAALAQVMAVASTNSSDQQSSFSNEGTYVEIAAPGSTIYSSVVNGYDYYDGTSMAAPHVAGLAALIWAKEPGWSNEQVRTKIQQTAVDLGAAGRDIKFGYGRINASAAMSGLGAAPATQIEPPAEDIQMTAIDENAPFVPGEILVKMKPGFNVSDVLQEDDLQVASVSAIIPAIEVQKLIVPAGQEISMVKKLQATDGVEYAELNYLVTLP